VSEINSLETGSLSKLLKILADGHFHSGEELGNILSISRAAVWKHLQKLQQLGLSLSSVKGKGYCLDGGLDLLDEKKIIHFLSTAKELSPSLMKIIKIEIFAQINSTNTYLMTMNDPRFHVCFAESQTAGRGRRGRSWVSPFAQNIYFSLAWGFSGGVAALEGLSLVIGLVMVRVLTRLGARDLSLKWPNDVLYRQKKLAGILIEMQGDPTGECCAVIGIGLNIKMQQSTAMTIDQPWIDLHEILSEQNKSVTFSTFLPSRNELAAMLLAELVNVLDNYEKLGFSAYIDEWLEVCAYKQQKVELRTASHIQQGILLGVNHLGALVLQTENGEMQFHGGEVSLRCGGCDDT
jgi:BirA family transcriptional regulator, biotin operon repressor / biotin---[acetyl-CoA-carboxylase] ligase